MPGGLVDHTDHLPIGLGWVSPGDSAPVGGKRLLQAAGLARSRLDRGPRGAVHPPRGELAADEV